MELSVYSFFNRPFFFIFVFLKVNSLGAQVMFKIFLTTKFEPWTVMFEATAVPTESQPLAKCFLLWQLIKESKMQADPSM